MDKALTRPFTASQAAAVETRLWGLLQRQVQHYTMAESSSVPIEVAQELLKGVNDLIGQGLYGEKDPQEQLLRGDLDQVIQRGLERVNQQVQEGLKLYQYVRAHPPVVTNRAYRETAANILAFFHTYQPQFMPHMDRLHHRLSAVPARQRRVGRNPLFERLSHPSGGGESAAELLRPRGGGVCVERRLTGL